MKHSCFTCQSFEYDTIQYTYARLVGESTENFVDYKCIHGRLVGNSTYPSFFLNWGGLGCHEYKEKTK